VSFFICVSGLLIQTAVGTAAGLGAWWTKRSDGRDRRHRARFALFENERGLVVVHYGRGEQAQPGMAVFLVVPAEKSLRKSPAILNTAETIRKLRSIFSWYGIDFPNTDCRRRRVGGCAFW